MIKKERYRPFTRECHPRILSEGRLILNMLFFLPCDHSGPSLKSLGVVVKAGKQGSVNCRTLNALAAAFSLSFSFLILILFCGTVRCVTFKWLAVPFLLDLACLRRSSSLGWAPGPTYTLVGASPSITPQFKLCI